MAGRPPDVDGYLDELTAVLQKAIDRVRRMAIARLRERAISRTLVAAGPWIDDNGRYATGPFQLGDPNLFTAEEWADMFQVDAVDVIGDVVVDTATREALLLGGNISDDAIAEVVAAHMTKMRGIGDDVRASVSETLQLAARDRLSLDDTIRELAATGPLSADAAKRWATTELHAAANGGMHAAWESAGVPFKRWRTVEDNRVRDAHEAIDGQTVPTAMDFEVDGHPAAFPGDPRLPIELRVNCRCWPQPIDAAGQVRLSTLDDATRDDLRALATKLQIPGRGRMRKPELRASIDRYLAGFGDQRIDTMTRAQLLRRARAANIVGRHQMTRRQLIGELANPRGTSWRSDTGYVSREELSAARQQVAARVTGRRQTAVTVPPPVNPGELRAEVVDRYMAPSGYTPCVSCGARLGAGAEAASLARISAASGWDVGNVAPVCRACARGLALFGGDLAALLHHQPAALVASPMQFANPWHDENGRFAPKGTGGTGGGGGSEPRRLDDVTGGIDLGDYDRLAAIKRDGAEAVAATMTDEERQGVDQIAALTMADLDANQLSRVISFEGSESMNDRREDITVGLGMQVAALESARRESMFDSDVDQTIHDAQNAFTLGEISAADLSDVIATEAGIDVYEGAASWMASRWAYRSTSPQSIAAHLEVARQHGLESAASSMSSYVDHVEYGNGELVLQHMQPMVAAVTAATYRNTQARLAELVPDGQPIEVFRGLSSDAPIRTGDQLAPSPLSSWSTSHDVARGFANYTEEGVTITAHVPRESIFSIGALTGFGAAFEQEIVVLGRPLPVVNAERNAGIAAAVQAPILIDDPAVSDPDWLHHDDPSTDEPADDTDDEGFSSPVQFSNPWHDERGRFAPKGTGSRGGTDRVTATSESHALASSIARQAQEAEPAITARIADLAGDPDPATYGDGSADLYGYEHRLKKQAAIAEKIERIMVEKNYTREQAAADIKDAVRYTVHFADDEFGASAQTVIDGLREQHPHVVVKNTWGSDKPYKGINVQVRTSLGLPFEVQFHTPTSQAVKDQMHVIYEQQRVLQPSSPRWAQMDREMLQISLSQPFPNGAAFVASAATMVVEGKEHPMTALGYATAWWTHKPTTGQPIDLVARWYWPETTRLEVNDGSGWRDAPLWIELQEDPDWIEVDEATAQEWLDGGGRIDAW